MPNWDPSGSNNLTKSVADNPRKKKADPKKVFKNDSKHDSENDSKEKTPQKMAKQPLPCLLGLEGEVMRPGQTLFIRGVMNEDSEIKPPKNIDISLASGREVADSELKRLETPECEVLLRLNLKIEEKQFGFSSFMTTNNMSAWEDEETADLNIKPGEDFDLRVRALKKSFEIWSQSIRVHEYKYTHPRNITSYVLIDGDLELNKCAWEGHYYTVPLEVELSNVLQPGGAIFIAGIVKRPKAGQYFSVEIKDTNDKSIFLFRADLAKNKITGSIDYLPKFPFKVEQCFWLVLATDKYGTIYPVYADGEEISRERKNKPVKNKKSVVKPDKMFIKGDIDIQAIQF